MYDREKERMSVDEMNKRENEQTNKQANKQGKNDE